MPFCSAVINKLVELSLLADTIHRPGEEPKRGWKSKQEEIDTHLFNAVRAVLLLCIFKSACMKDGTLDYVWLWILCGLPFGLHRMCLWINPGGRSFGGGIAVAAFGFIIGGVNGGFVLVWRLLVAAWYVPLTVYCLLTY